MRGRGDAKLFNHTDGLIHFLMRDFESLRHVGHCFLLAVFGNCNLKPNANETGWTWLAKDRFEHGPEHDEAVWQALCFNSKEHARQFENVVDDGTAAMPCCSCGESLTLLRWRGHSDAAPSADGRVLPCCVQVARFGGHSAPSWWMNTFSLVCLFMEKIVEAIQLLPIAVDTTEAQMHPLTS